MSNQNDTLQMNVNPLENEKIEKLLLRFSIPCIMAMLVNALYNIVDQVFIGQGVGYLGNAATNVVFPVTAVSLGFALLVGDGCAAKYSLLMGNGDNESGVKVIGNSMILIIIISIIIATIGYCFTDSILYFFGATDNCIEYARIYLRIILAGIPFYMFSSGMNSVIRADGSPQYGMLSMLAGAITNLILDPIAIFVLHWGVKGAAIATIIGQIISCTITIIYFFHPKTFKLSKDVFRFRPRLVVNSCSLGMSSFITQFSIVAICAVTNNIIVKYGPESEFGADIPLSVIGIVMKVFSIVIAIIVGISVGAQPILGYNYGAKKYGRVLETYKIVIIACAIVGAIATLLFEFAPNAIISIFGSEGETYNKFAVLCFRIYLGGILFCCIQKSSSIFLQSIGKPVKATLLSLSREIFIQIPTVIILPMYYGIIGALWSAPISDVVSVILTGIFIVSECKKMKKAESCKKYLT